ncbi:MAG: type II secretion system protein [Candidatus Omnitrophica bacterium]|jgi:MSHA pilin protein MshD|nr:type II secretion system GspH family protein [Candidatus Omnitrophota bacterium]MDD5079296.1 type II secretion system protein [Candidatus Omnitrophota bacterium]MDD5775903.1 type II secretion system protein [Candidatus Omnitrophota bacterium]
MRRLNNRGLTLIELIVIIVVMGLAIPALIANLATITWRSTQSQAIGDSLSYARSLLEEIKVKDFSDPDDPDNTTLGVNADDVYPNYNDVDDYNGYNDTPASGFSRRVAVDYVNLSSNQWSDSADPTDFKRVNVTVSSSAGFSGNITLEYVASAYKFF